MDTSTGVIAIIPAPGAERVLLSTPLLSAPLLAQNVRFAAACAEIVRTYVATVDPALRAIAEAAGARIFPFELSGPAADQTLRDHFHELETGGEWYRWVLWLDPKRPLRDRFSVLESFQRCIVNGESDGILSVSPGGDWMVTDEGWLRPASPGAPKTWDIDGVLKMLRADAYRNDALPLDKMNCMAYHSAPGTATVVHSPADVPMAERIARERPHDLEWLLQ